MQRSQTLRAAYKNFFAWLGQPDLYKPVTGAGLEYSAVFPLIYLKIRLEGLKEVRRDVKHLLISENGAHPAADRGFYRQRPPHPGIICKTQGQEE